MSDPEDKSPDEEIFFDFEYFFEQDFQSFTVTVDSEKPMEVEDMVQAFRAFALGLEEGKFPLYRHDEITLH